jgi:hypothetical protein
MANIAPSTSTTLETQEPELLWKSSDTSSRSAHGANTSSHHNIALLEDLGTDGSVLDSAGKITKERGRAAKSKHELTLTDQTNLLPFKRILAVFGGLSLCALVSCLDSTIVATALPSISAAFNAGSVSSWVPSAYLLTSTAFQPLCEFCGNKTCRVSSAIIP